MEQLMELFLLHNFQLSGWTFVRLDLNFVLESLLCWFRQRICGL